MIIKSMSKLTTTVITSIFTIIIIGYFSGVIDNIIGVIDNIIDTINSFVKYYPIFSGVMLSWSIAVASTGIILLFAYINRGKSDQYDKIFRKYEKLLMSVNIAVLFYISINLASEALTKAGVPIFSTTYEIANFIQISPQDAFLISLVFMTIFLLFVVAPYYEIKILPLISIALLIIIVLFSIFAKPVPELNQNNVLAQKGPFFVTSILGLMFTIVLFLKIPEKAKGDNYNDLCMYFSIMPAPIVASLVLIGHKLVTFPNLAGNIIVGFLFISGFASLVILTVITLKNRKIGYCIWIFAAFLSLFAISSFSFLFLVLKPFFYDISTFRNTLMFSIAIMLLILQYGFSYEKLLKYKFTEWWRREWRPKAMVISILTVLIVGAISPEFELWGVPVKLLCVFLALFLVVYLPWILGIITFRKTFWKNI